MKKFVPRSRSEFFATNATDPPHWTLNSCFCVYCTIWMHSGPFGCLTKPDAKRAEVVQKFVPWSRVRIFRNERTHPPYWTQNSCLILFHTIFVHLAPFCCITKLSAKRAKLMQKFGPRSRVGIFRDERNRSTPLDSKLMCLVCFVLFGCIWTVWFSYKTQCKMGRTGAKVRAMKSCWNFSQRTHPIHPIGPWPHVSLRFVLFGCIWDSLLRYNTQCKMGQPGAKVRATKSRRNFS